MRGHRRLPGRSREGHFMQRVQTHKIPIARALEELYDIQYASGHRAWGKSVLLILDKCKRIKTTQRETSFL